MALGNDPTRRLDGLRAALDATAGQLSKTLHRTVARLRDQIRDDLHDTGADAPTYIAHLDRSLRSRVFKPLPNLARALSDTLKTVRARAKVVGTRGVRPAAPARPGRLRELHRQVHPRPPAEPADRLPHGPNQFRQDLRGRSKRWRRRRPGRISRRSGCWRWRTTSAGGARASRRHGHGGRASRRARCHPHGAHHRDGGPPPPGRRRGDRRDPNDLRSRSRLGLDQRAVRDPGKTVIVCGSDDALSHVRRAAEAAGESLDVVTFQRKTPLVALDTPVPLDDVQPGDAVVAFSRRAVHEIRETLVAAGRSVATIYGALSPEVRRAEARRFRDGEAEVLVTTDAIGMGLNLGPLKRVVFSAVTKWDGTAIRPLTNPEIRQIAGRAGRFGHQDEGHVSATDDASLGPIRDALAGAPTAPAADTRFYVRPDLIAIEAAALELNTASLADVLAHFSRATFYDGSPFQPSAMEEPWTPRAQSTWRASRSARRSPSRSRADRPPRCPVQGHARPLGPSPRGGIFRTCAAGAVRRRTRRSGAHGQARRRLSLAGTALPPDVRRDRCDEGVARPCQRGNRGAPPGDGRRARWRHTAPAMPSFERRPGTTARRTPRRSQGSRRIGRTDRTTDECRCHGEGAPMARRRDRPTPRALGDRIGEPPVISQGRFRSPGHGFHDGAGVGDPVLRCTAPSGVLAGLADHPIGRHIREHGRAFLFECLSGDAESKTEIGNARGIIELIEAIRNDDLRIPASKASKHVPIPPW